VIPKELERIGKGAKLFVTASAEHGRPSKQRRNGLEAPDGFERFGGLLEVT
jgi:hypothetical protein